MATLLKSKEEEEEEEEEEETKKAEFAKIVRAVNSDSFSTDKSDTDTTATNNTYNQEYLNKMNEFRNIVNSVNPTIKVNEVDEEEQKIDSILPENKKSTIKEGLTEDTSQLLDETQDNSINEEQEQLKAQIDEQVKNAGNAQTTVTSDASALKKQKATGNNSLNKLQNSNISVGSKEEVGNNSKWYQNFFKSSDTFDDGYDVGDVTKTTVSSLADLCLSFVKGVVQVGEGIGKFLATGVAQVADWTGNEEYAKNLRNAIATETPPISSSINNVQEDVDKNSVLGSTTDTINESFGYIAAIATTEYFTGGMGGNIVMFSSAAGNKAAEVYSKDNVEDWQAWTEIAGNGLVEVVSERLFGLFGTSGLDEELANYAASQFSSGVLKTLARMGVSATGEAAEEVISYMGGQGIDTLVDTISSLQGKDSDFKEDWNWEELGESATTAFISTLILGGATSTMAVQDTKSQNNVSAKEAINIIAKQQDISARKEKAYSELDNINQKMQKTDNQNSLDKLQLKKDLIEIELSSTSSFYISKYDTNGELKSLSSTYGKLIDNINSEINITPAIVKNDNYYNIIDSNNGTILDSTQYQTFKEAENGFNDKIKKLNDLQIKDINKKMNEANYVIANKIMDITNQSREQISQQEANNKTEDTRTSTEKFDNVLKSISQIQNKTSYSNKDAYNIIQFVDRNIDNVSVAIQSGSIYINSLNKDGSIAYQQKLDKSKYTGEEIKSIVNTAVQNADLSNIDLKTNAIANQSSNTAQTSQKTKSSNFYTGTTNYAVEDIKKVTKPFESKKSYTKNELAEIWNDEIDEKNYDAVFDSKGNVESYIAVEEDGKNLVVNQYDNEDNVVKSEVIEKTKNGRYTSEAVTNAIERASSIYDENKPIKGQVDIEGNEVRNLKKKNTNNYTNFKELIKQEEENAILNFQPSINITISEDIQNIKLKDIKQSEAIKIAKNTFKENNNKRIFKNKETGNNIKVIADDIKESIHKTFTNKSQKKYLRESIASFSRIDSIIENGKKVSEATEQKNRNIYKGWNYYITQAIINDKPFLIEFDAALEEDGWHFRVERLKEINKKVDTPLATTKKSMLIQGKSTSIDNSITQKNENVKSEKNTANNSNMQNEKNNTSKLKTQNGGLTKTQYDSLGRELSKSQQDYFKDSKVRDENGNLLVMYHGTEANVGIPEEFWFTIFDIDKAGDHGNMLGNGFYFTSNKEHAQQYAHTRGNIYEAYLNITNPLELQQFSTGDLTYAIRYINPYIEADVYNKDGTIDGYKVREYLLKNGYDGIHSNNVYVAFESNQIKNTTNETPTSNNDIRYMKKNNTSRTLKANTAQTNENKNTDILNTNSTLYVEEEKQIKKELHNRIQNAIISKNSRKNTFLGNVAEKVANKIKNMYGIDVTGRKHTISDNDIRHIIKQHGNPEIEKTRGQIAVTSKDIEKIPDIINNYDKITKGNTNNNHLNNKEFQTIRYIKQYSDNISYIVEVIPDTGNNLTIKTMWKKAINSNISTLKKNPIGVNHDNKNIVPQNTSETKSNSGSNNSISQNIKNVKNEIRSMKKDNTSKILRANSTNNSSEVTDNQGRKLSKGQQDYFKDSKVVDENGNLITAYHGSDKDFYVFKNKDVQHGRAITDGYYFTTNIENAQSYGENVKEVYIDIKNPFYLHNNNGVTTELKERGFNIENLIETNVLEADSSGVVPTAKSLKNFIKKMGYDGVITLTGNNEQVDMKNLNNQIVIFKSSQAKDVTNTNPTTNEDIRFAKRTAKDVKQNIDNTQRNAERASSYIEQEIQKIEKTGNWDNSIPVTRMTDIRKTIEDYLGLGIKKGKFRQSAYGIYKSNRDVIRTKEFKDMDTILHETGHALDLGNRLKLDKESIADELLNAVTKYGGYETESRTVKLEEGFAEVIREYSIIPEQAKLDYPQSVAVIEKIRQNNTSFDKFIAKVQEQTYNYIHQNPQNRVLSNQSIGEQTDKIPLSKEWIKEKTTEHLFDKDYVLKSAVSNLQKVNGKTKNQLKASDNAYLLTRLSNGIGDKVISMLSEGYIDENGNKLMPGLNQIGEILGNDAQRFNDLRTYLVARRDTDYKAKTLMTGIRSMDSKAVIELFKNDKQIQEAAKLVYDTLDGVMQYAVNNGLITQEVADNLKESNAFYVPMQRVLENNGNQIGKKGAVADIIKKRTGSELDIKDVLENIIANTTNIVQQVENNNILKALYNQGEESGLTGTVYDVIDTPVVKIGTEQLSTWKSELNKQGVNTAELDLEKTIDLFVPNNKVDTKNLITSFINDDGKRIYLQFNDSTLFSSIMGLDTESTSVVLNISNKLNTPLRYGATMANLGFAIPNMISDTVQATIYSTAGFIPIVDNALGVLDVLAATNSTVRNFVNKVAPEYAKRINTMYALYQQSGASSGTRIAQERKSIQNLMKDVYGTKNSETLGIDEKYKPLKRLLDLMTYIPEISEQSTRFEVFKKNYDYYTNKGTSEMDTRILSALESRDATQDFSRMGKTTREINKIIPFSAARVGSIYTFAEKVTASPKQIGMRIAVLTAIAMAIKAIGYDDKEIEELNQRKKADNFILKMGDNVVTIKKPQGILRSMINLAEYIQDLATDHIEDGKEGERLGEWLKDSIMDSFFTDDITGFAPNAITPLIENAVNKDFYYKTDIVKSYDLDLPDSEQYYDYNSQLAILLGKVFNYSPAKIDNLISGYFGGLGTSITSAMDSILGKMGIITERADMGAEDNTVGKRFIVNVNTNSASIDEIYERKTELTKKKNGGTITDEETTELETLTNAISNISKLNKQIKEIKADLTMSGSEKAEQIKILQQERTDTARQALGKDLIYNENASKIQTTSFYPSTSSLSKSGYTLTLSSDMKEEYAELASSYYNKYASQGLYSAEKLEDIESKAKDYAKNYLFNKYKSIIVKSK